MAGNNYVSEIETTRADSGVGVFLKGEKQGAFLNTKTGFFADKDVRELKKVKTKTGTSVIVINNNGNHQMYNKSK